VVISGDVTVAAAGMMAGVGSGPDEAGTRRCGVEATGAGEVGAAEVGVAVGARTNRSAGGCPARAKLTATDAATTPAATPAAVSARQRIPGRGGLAGRDRLDG